MTAKPQSGYLTEPIVIIGSACRFPGDSSSPSKLWELLREPRDVLREIPDSRFNPAGFYHEDALHHGTTNVKHAYQLDDDIGVFDAQFFGIKPVEANSVDPQQRILLETVYEGLERAGIPLETLQGSQTGVYVGVMSADYDSILGRDLDTFPTYFASGTARSILSNRISYFFDWHGPSMTIDTACSSSLFALHLAVRSLRSGESPTAVVAGANLVLTPDQFIAESKLKMLSPDGRSRMWDKDANGYARGDGVAALVLKTLSAAIADGDSIECIIRETGINQDGRTKGITMPSPIAQAALIRATYEKAGLDLSKQSDRPQYFEAHGTGTPAGDPVEAEAISTAFFGPRSGFKRAPQDDPLYIGSIKTVIGHTEGTAGVAGIIKGSLALQHGVIPPNLLLNELSPAVKPFYSNLKILDKAKVWPELPDGVSPRVSVNSFGFGGANGHAILEKYTPPDFDLVSVKEQRLRLFLFSAASNAALAGSLSSFASYLRANPTVSLRDLSWTLSARRSTLPVRLPLTALTVESLISKLEDASTTLSGAVTASSNSSGTEYPRLLGIFTGQGAQWPSMGAQLLAESKLASERIQVLQDALDSLPEEHRPAWSLREELTKDKTTSRVGEAAFSQPLCTAVQIILVDHLKAANVHFAAVVGHSSGEIAAAYAAGYLSARDAIRIAYYRGFFLHLAQGPEESGGGAMMAVGTTYEDAQAVCELDDYVGRVVVAASNSPDSQTLSGDRQAVEEVKVILEDENKFARLLKVDKAYHSHHMIPCTGPYIEALKSAGITTQPRQDGNAAWISSVYGEDIETIGTETLGAEYWSRNMANQVLFAQAVEYAVGAKGPFNLALEVGPHPALKSPALQTIKAAAGQEIPYAGTLRRGANDAEAFAEALGSLWASLGTKAVDFTAFERRSYGDGVEIPPPRLLKDLPTYSWEHDRVYWHESRYSRALRSGSQPPHQLLGTRVPDGTEKNNEVRWKNHLHPREIPWLVHHQVERQIVFPAAGYLSAALEAVVQLYGTDSVRLLDIHDVTIGQALVLQENSDVETLFSLRATQVTEGHVEAVFTFYSAPAAAKSSTDLVKNASGRLRVTLGGPARDVLPSPYAPERHQFLDVESERFYNTVAEVGLGYTGPFRKLTETSRRLHEATGFIQTPDAEDEGDPQRPLLLHPGTLDSAIQAIILAHSYPGDGRVRSIYLPTGIDSVRIDPSALVKLKGPAGSKLPFYASVTSDKQTDLSGDVEVHSADGSTVLLQLQGLRTTPLTPPDASNDVRLFFETSWEAESPTGNSHMFDDDQEHTEEFALSFSLERVAYYYVKELDKAIPKAERGDLEWHHKIFYEYIDHVVSWVAEGTHPYAKKEWVHDTKEVVLSVLKRFPDSIDLQIMQAVGENLLSAMRNEINILEAMMKDNMLTNFYAYALGMERYLLDLTRMVGQISRRFPHINVLEIGAGTGGATEEILEQLGGSFASYTYTDISSGFFEKAQERFEQHRSRMIFKVLDIEKDIEDQGYAPQSFDLVIASLVLHATRNLEDTLKNVRKLLKPGGRLLLLELTDNDPIRFGFIFGGLPGWWLGYDDGRKLSPCVSAEEWEVVFKKTGFSSIEALTPHNRTFPLPLSVIVIQAVDDRVEFLRDPLSSAAQSLEVEHLTIVGGHSSATRELAKGIQQAVQVHYKNAVHHIESLESVSESGLPFLGSLISLVDLEDEPTFQNLTAGKLAGLQATFRQSKNVIWVTRGALSDSPFRNMYRGLQRTLVKEMQHLHVQLVDFGTATEVDSATIASRLLQLEAGTSWEQDARPEELLWYQEPEILIQDSTALVPRVRLSQKRNDRYNSGRRSITRRAILDDAIVSVRHQGGESGFAVQQTGSRDVAGTRGRIQIHLSQSLLRAVAFPDGSFLHLSTGFDAKTGGRVVLVSEHLDSQVHVPQDWTVPFAADTDEELKQTLLNLYTQLLADSILSGTKVGEVVAVLDPGYTLGAVVAQRAAEKGVRVVLLSSKETASAGEEVFARPWVSIHPRATRRALEGALPRNLTRLFNVAGSRDFVDLLVDYLPQHVVVRDRKSLTSPSSRLAVDFFSTVPTIASNHLRLVLARSSRDAVLVGEDESLPSVTLSDLATGQLGPTAEQAILPWRSSSHVPVHVQPASKVVRFRKDRTYWMVGLTGSLGLSLCEFMAKRGAGYIVLSSRNPKVDKGWLQAVADLGCTVKVFANDITSREDVKALHRRIVETLPPIAGVSQGAMVLQDSLFPDVDLERVQKVLKPKVAGSIYLNEIFSEKTKPLDFFVFFSSVAYVTGNAGQSIYGAANAFMASLATQRRHLGLAASVINIGAILGAGYVSRELSQQQQEYLRKVGHVWMSEQDAHEIFAEGVLSSSPDAAEPHEFETGFRTDKNRAQDLEAEPPMFQHLRSTTSDQVDVGGSKTKHLIKTKAQLLEATTHEQVFEILKEGFLLKLQIALQADPNKPMLEISLDELGADSLVAVDIRSWFLKELGVDLPVLKILNSPSVRELLLSAQELLPSSAIPRVGSKGSGNSPPGDTSPELAGPTHQPTSTPPELAVSIPPESVLSPAFSTRSYFDVDGAAGSSATAETSLEASEADDAESKSVSEGLEAKRHVERSLPLSFGQARFWFLKHYVQDQTSFNISTVIKLRGKILIDALGRAVVAVGQRHEALRTAFLTDEKTRKPLQAVLSSPGFRLEVATIGSDEQLDDAVQRLKNHVYDLERGEALRIQLLSVSPERHYLLLGYHHIYLDGIGYLVFISDLEKAYSGTLNTKPPSSEVLQYPDFTERQIREYQTGAWSEELSFWRTQFPDLPEPLPLLPLAGAPTRPNSAKLGLGTHTASWRIPKDLSDRITQVCRQFKVSPFHLYVAVFHLVLYRYSNLRAEDMAIGVADGNRKEADVLQSLGIFLNVLPLRLKRNARHTFAETLKDVRTAAQGAFANSRVPFDVLLNELGVPREPSHSPLFQAFVNYRQNATEARRLLGCDGELDIISAGQTDHDVSLDILDLSSSGGESLVVLAVEKHLYEAEAANILLKSYEGLLRHFVANPAARVTWPPLHDKEDVNRALEAGRGPERPSAYPTVVHGIDAIAEKYSDRVALLESSGKRLSYQALTKRVSAIAERFIEHGIGRGAVVGVFLSATADWTLTLLAILRLGAVYVPLDPKMGVDRLSLITRDSRPIAIAVDSVTESHEFARSHGAPGSFIVIVNVSDIAPEPRNPMEIPIQASPDDLAVIMYSSGSTGVPKGVKLNHANFNHYAEIAPVEWGMREGYEVFLHQASYMFDASLLQTLVPLGVGSTVVIAGREARGDPAALSELVARENVTYVGATPTEYLAWARHWDIELLRRSAWRVAFTWGEPLSKRQLREFQRLAKPDLKLVDAYGPVETTISVGHGEVPLVETVLDGHDAPGNPRVPLTLIPNASVRIVDEALHPVPAGVVGEILIGGAGVSKGYLKDDELTASKFVPDEQASELFRNNEWTTAYRTGDRGWLTQDGRLVLQGRIEGSTQIKLAGIRIELQDIESVITQVHKRVRQAVVSVRTSSASATLFLAAFVLLAEDEKDRFGSSEERDRFLSGLPRTLPLPQYMRPAVAVAVEQLPTNSSGKLDRRTVNSWPLPDSASAQALETDAHGKLTQLETTLSQLWAEALPQGLLLSQGSNGGSITSHSDFFHLGGSSLALINLQGLIKERLNLSIPVFQLFQASTLGAMAAVLQQQQTSSESHHAEEIQPAPAEINWEDEVAIPSDLLNIKINDKPDPLQPGKPRAVALTGSTGFIGREILRQLLPDPRISKVYCLAVRKTPAEAAAAFPNPFGHPKVVILQGDLGLPRLGLSSAAVASIFGEVDAVIHSGADVSFLKTYQSLRLTNVASTRELVRLAAPRRVPLHFVSSAAVARLAAASTGSDSFDAESAAPYYPPRAPGTAAKDDGYAVAKLVAEVLLERAAQKLGLPVHIHRPSSVTGEGAGELDLMANMAKYVAQIKAVPDTRGWVGRFDFVGVQSVARDIVKAVLEERAEHSGGGGDGGVGGERQLVRFSYQAGEVVVDGDDVQQSASIAGGGAALEVVPFDVWVDRAEGVGLNPLLALYLRRAAKGGLLLPKLLKE